MRYDVHRDFGGKVKETRREYNARFGQPPGPEADIPDAASHIWEWFWSLNARRSFADSGILPIAYSEIDAWARRMRIDITPAEIEILSRMDDALLDAHGIEAEAQQQRAQSKAPKPKPK